MKTDFLKYWKLETTAYGRQRWIFTAPPHLSDWQSAEGKHFLKQMQAAFVFDKTENPNAADQVYRYQQSSNKVSAPKGANPLEKALDYYQSLQAESGHFPGDYGGPHFLTPGLIIASHITDSPLPIPYQVLIKQYMFNHQNTDGGWGLHIEDCSTMFGTVLQYVSLRLLGVSPEHDVLLAAKKWIHLQGGATGIPSWGKFYLSVLGLYEWQGCNSLLPEMWLLPDALPFHPGKYWCHARMVYLPMSYCYGVKLTCPTTTIIDQIRKEIYTQPYDQINWIKARNECAATDLYRPQTTFLRTLNTFTNTYEKSAPSGIRKKATNLILDIICAEDEHTQSINIGPVNQAINSICIWHAYGKESKQFKQHYDRWFDYLWLAEDGIKMNGYNGSQFWDTAFAAQASLEAFESKKIPSAEKIITNAYRFIDISQVKTEVRDHSKYYRHASRSGWPFSTVEHGWPITDCTAEGIKTTLQINAGGFIPTHQLISDERIIEATDLLLSFQNKNGGWASYERTRAGSWLEQLNPSEIFGNIMIDYSYTECTSACVQSLITFQEKFPHHRKADVANAIKTGIQFILNQQGNDGLWYGSWAVCFTYGTWFAVEALSHFNSMNFSGEKKIQAALQRAETSLISKQNPDGGWGERFSACLEKKYVPDTISQITHTSWALLALMQSKNQNKEAIEKGIKYLESMQLPSGDFPQQSISGVFNHSCGITYTAYRNVFPIWALARYSKLCLKNESERI